MGICKVVQFVDCDENSVQFDQDGDICVDGVCVISFCTYGDSGRLVLDLPTLREFRDFVVAEVARIEAEAGGGADDAPDLHSEGFPGNWSKILADVSAVDPDAGTALLGLMRASMRGEASVELEHNAPTLDFLFSWRKSPQGFNYWERVWSAVAEAKAEGGGA